MDLNRFNIPGNKEKNEVLSMQNFRLIRLRWFYLGSLAGIASVSSLLAANYSDALRFVLFGLVGFALNLLFFGATNLFKNRMRPLYAVMMLQLIMDLGFATLVTYQQGGLEARTTVLYTFPILAAGLVFARYVVYITALLSSVGYVTVGILYKFQNNLDITTSNALVPVIFYPALFFVFAKLVIYLSESIHQDIRERAYISFLAMLSHQLKHPVSTANTIIDLIENEEPDSIEKYKQYINMLKTENLNLLQLLNNLLETAAPDKSLQKSEMEAIELPPMLQRLAYQSAESHGRLADLQLHLRDMSLKVLGSSERLANSLTNVLDNAFKYSDSGTPVTVSAKKSPEAVVITIEDKGKGLDKFAKKQLYKMYSIQERAGRGIKGLGLGLFVAKKSIRAQAGSLHVVSGKSGTKVLITLIRSTKK